MSLDSVILANCKTKLENNILDEMSSNLWDLNKLFIIINIMISFYILIFF